MVDLPLDAALARRALEQTAIEIRRHADRLLAIPDEELPDAVAVLREASGLMSGPRGRAAYRRLADGLEAGNRDAITRALIRVHSGALAGIADRQ